MIDPSAIYQTKVDEINQLMESKRALAGKSSASASSSFQDSLDASLSETETVADDLASITYADGGASLLENNSAAYQAAQVANNTTTNTSSTSMEDDISSMMSTMMTLMQSSMTMSSISSMSGDSSGGGDAMSSMMSMLMMTLMMKMMGNMTDSASSSQNASSTTAASSVSAQQAASAYSSSSQASSNLMLDKAAQYEDEINAAAEKYNISPALIKGIIQAESGFNANSVSSAGAKGLMQLMDATAAEVGVTDSFDPAQNIDGATQYIAKLLDRFDGDLKLTLAAYNTGPNKVARQGITSSSDANYQSLPQIVRDYADKVVSYAQGYAQAA